MRLEGAGCSEGGAAEIHPASVGRKEEQRSGFCKWLLTTFYIVLEVCKGPMYTTVKTPAVQESGLSRGTVHFWKVIGEVLSPPGQQSELFVYRCL